MRIKAELLQDYCFELAIESLCIVLRVQKGKLRQVFEMYLK